MKQATAEYDRGPIVATVDSLIADAIEKGASDIHIEPHEHGLRVRYRIDGVLYDQSPIESAHAAQVVSRLKVMAMIDIAEKRIPHDGKLSLNHNGRHIDLRFSTFPTIHGEKVVIRILDRARNVLQLDALGFLPDTLEQCKSLLSRSSGFFLVSGPTGSGKTTTLYAALTLLNAPHKNVITLEDPVEYIITGTSQGQIRPDVGFTFERGIRSLLRQDPDIVMVGEIRDKQTAQIAIEAALTGHVVMSTVHTNDAPSVIMRLMDMGIEPFLINAALSGVLAQRLARKLCMSCRQEKAPDVHEKEVLARLGAKLDRVHAAPGCAACNNTGHQGRIGLFELLPMNSALRSLIVQHPNFDAIHAQARANGMRTLLDDGLAKCAQGIISVAELVRVVG